MWVADGWPALWKATLSRGARCATRVQRVGATAGGRKLSPRATAAVAATSVYIVALVVAGGPALAHARTAPSARTAEQAVAEYGPAARSRLAPAFESAGVAYPPAKLVLAAIKSDRTLEVWASRQGAWRYVTSYRILGASGHAGPKLREGDRQVPEGVYHVTSLNANSAYHLAMRLDYPNAFDRAHAKKDGRTNLGGDIFIHGGVRSTGCLAMGDESIEELFVLVAETGLKNVTVLIAPTDPRKGPLQAAGTGEPTWVPELYATIDRQFAQLVRSRPDPAAGVSPAEAASPGAQDASATLAHREGSRKDAAGRWSAIVLGVLGGLTVLGLGAVLVRRRRLRTARRR